MKKYTISQKQVLDEINGISRFPRKADYGRYKRHEKAIWFLLANRVISRGNDNILTINK